MYTYEFYVSISLVVLLTIISAMTLYDCFIEPVIICIKNKIKTKHEKEISIEEINNWLTKLNEDEELFKLFQDAVEGKFANLPALPVNPFVKAVYPCPDPERKHCIAWPDRCEECGGDGQVCSTIINLNELCNIESPVVNTEIKLTHDQEITEEMSKQLADYIVQLQKANSDIYKNIWH